MNLITELFYLNKYTEKIAFLSDKTIVEKKMCNSFIIYSYIYINVLNICVFFY